METTDWLLDADPAIRWQVLRDLLDAPADEVAAERARVATEGWGARLLAARDPDGQWAGGACFPGDHDWSAQAAGQPWTSTFPSLDLLRLYGLDPDSPQAREAVAKVQASCRWEHAGQPFFEGEVEPCINGRTVAIGAYFGIDMAPVVERLLGEQLADGGWNCEVENGSVRSSFHTTICVLEGLIEYDEARGRVAEVGEACRRGEDYLLKRHLMKRLSTGEVVEPAWLELAFPPQWKYDVLRGLDCFRRADRHDTRLAEAVRLVESKRQPDGSWLLERTHPGDVHFAMEQDGAPSRWNTLRALRVLRWWDARSA